MTQTRSRPPTFVLWTNTIADEMPRHYIRQIQNAMRQEFRMEGVPIRLPGRRQRRSLGIGLACGWKLIGGCPRSGPTPRVKSERRSVFYTHIWPTSTELSTMLAKSCADFRELLAKPTELRICGPNLESRFGAKFG